MPGQNRRSRRSFLVTTGTAISALAGCSGNKAPESSTVTNTGRSTTLTSTTTTQETTGTKDREWTVNPVDHDKLVGAFYYAWYDDGYWEEWGAPGEPLLGRYDSRDEEAINQHIKWAVEHGINCWVLNWHRMEPPETWVEDHFLEAELSGEISFLMHPTPARFTWDGNYADFDHPDTREGLRRDLEHFEQMYFDQPNYQHIDGKPAVYYYGARWYKGDVAGALEKAQETIDTDLYLIADILAARTHPRVITREWMDAFDAVNTYSLYNKDVAASGQFSDFVDFVESSMSQWDLMADHYGFDFIPTVMPAGYPTGDSTNPILERSENGFRDLTQLAMDRMDQDIDTIFITSFNEWPEYTSVEPGEQYGTTYLDIVKEEISNTSPEYFDPSDFHKLALEFNRTGEGDISMKARRIRVSQGDGSAREYNIGVPSEEPYLVAGINAPQPAHIPINEKPEDSLETWRAFGRPDEMKMVAYLSCNNPEEITLLGNPTAQTGIEADVYFNGTHVDHLDLEAHPQPQEYHLTL